MRRLAALALWLSLSTAGCSLVPDYRRPADLPVPPAWPGPSAATGEAAADDIGWRDFFPDRRLQRLIETALANNHDLRVAALDIEAAEANYRAQHAGLFPSLSGSGTELVERYPPGVASTGGGAGSGGYILRTYDVGVGFSAYELDLFGKVRSLSEQAFEQYLGYGENRKSVQISLVAEVATAWLTILADEALIRLSRSTLDSQTDSYRLTRRSVAIGTGTALAARQAEISVATARASLAGYQRQLAQDRNTLVDLLGIGKAALDLEGADFDEVEIMTALPDGVPSTVLTRRPDILSAEHQLMAANANIGAARAAFFPSISLTANGGTESGTLGKLFAPGSGAWTLEPQISIPIFTGGLNEANLDTAEIQKNIYVAQYQKAIQDAFRDVADALESRAPLDEQLSAEQQEVSAAQGDYDLSQLRFTSGVDTYLSVLTAQQTLFQAQQSLISLKLTRLENLVTLYKALGGGAVERSVTPAAVPSPSASAP